MSKPANVYTDYNHSSILIKRSVSRKPNLSAGWGLDKAHFPSDGSTGQYKNVYGLCSSQNQSPTVKIERVVTTGADSYERYSFAKNAAIWYWANVTNYYSSSLSTSYTWKALGPSSTTIFSWSGTIADSPGNHWWYANWSTIPSTAPTGYYTFQAKGTYNGTTSCRVNVFRVN